MNIRSMIFAASFCTCLWMWFGVVAQEPKPSAGAPDKKTEPKVVTPKDLRDDALAISGPVAIVGTSFGGLVGGNSRLPTRSAREPW